MKTENENNGMINLNEIAKQLKNVEQGVNSMVVPMLKDTIKDGNKHNTKLFVLCVIELIVIIILGVYSQFLVAKQNDKYQEFLSQFEFESESTIYQDTDDNSSIYDGIEINK